MVFNWFRRQFSDKDASTPEEEATITPAEVEPEAETSSEEDTAAEYLKWAKAAYQNIQQQQAQSTPQSIVENVIAEQGTAEIAEPETPVVPQADEPDAETPVVPQANEPDAEPETLVVPQANEPDAETPLAPSEELSNNLETEETTPLPFWAQTEADRLARIERLKATAIEEVEPEGSPQVQPTQELLVAFDEGFLWSAEILASQGRRPEDISLEEITWLKKLRQGLDKTRRSIVNQLKAIVGQGPLNQAAVTEIETLLLQADVGVQATDYIINALQERLKQEALPADEAIAYLKQILRDMLDRPLETYSRTFIPEKDTLNIWLMTGVNGAGKTTTIGKLAHIAQKSGYKCLIGAADTFRAAAVEQVKIWGARSGTEVVANPGQNTDPAAVVFDAIAAAQSRSIELLLVDTAGRLQNKKNLMDELSKIRRIVDKKAPDAKVESLLVLDSTLGQNGLRQAEVFAEAAQLSGVVLTKLDGTAKGGIALAVVQQLGLPIRFIGAGEGIEDLRPFSSYEFVEALLSN
ncbi:signal recognition particle-docking protein FtsY [Synechocystis sp. PCC 7509]|uniref:signal recognition particle-docking protein FtsY n=1 Tax=Synechocystis sp. PCC 7509 TaxID=927677 RepID=UPI0002AC2A93|nr:signal recognition particle-docking protein FtsY [Synechocystis sp. PCC 7509]